MIDEDLRRTITVEDFSGRWPEGYLAEEKEYCMEETVKFRKLSIELEKARQAVLDKRTEFYSYWWLKQDREE